MKNWLKTMENEILINIDILSNVFDGNLLDKCSNAIKIYTDLDNKKYVTLSEVKKILPKEFFLILKDEVQKKSIIFVD